MVQNSPANAGDERDTGLIPRPGRSPGGRHGNPLQYSCLENPTDRGGWRAIVPECMISCFIHVQLLATLWVYPARLLCPWDSPGKNTGVGCHAFLQEIFPTQESNPGLLHCRQILYQLSYEGSPHISDSESEVTQSCLTLCNLLDRSPPGSLFHGILQA